MTIAQTNYNTVNESLFPKRSSIVIPTVDSYKSIDGFGQSIKTVLAIQVNLESFGYSLAPELIKQMSFLNEEQLTDLYSWFIPFIQKEIGAHRQFTPMYPNFPKQVMLASDYELLMNALMHYTGDWLGVRILPAYEKAARLPLVSTQKPKMIKLAQLDNIPELFLSLINSNTSLSETDQEHIQKLFAHLSSTKELENVLRTQSNISQKETLALVSKLVLSNKELNFIDLMGTQFKTPTDVLRLAVSICNGDISLAANTKFKKVTRSQRKTIMQLLDNVFSQSKDTDQLLDNMYSYREMWLRLGEAIHAGEYATKFPQAFDAFSSIRTVQKKLSFNGKLDVALEHKNYEEAISLLVQRPGVFARNLNRLLQTIEGNIRTPIVKPKKTKVIVKNMFHGALEVETFAPNNPFSQLKGVFSPAQPEVGVPSKEVIVEAPAKELILNTDKAELIEKALTAFSQVSPNISTPVLLQVHHHFKVQHEKTVRAFLPKGMLSKAFVTDTNIAPLVNTVAQSIVDSCESALLARFKSLPSLGKTYIDPILEHQNVPFAMRSASKSLHTLSRGSKIPTDDTDVTRFFIWWNQSFTDENGQKQSVDRIDIDLSCILLDKDFNYVTQCSWTNTRDSGMFHSGDITSAPNGACEFIDVTRSMLHKDAQYVVMTVNAYTSQKYSELPECYAGWMGRNAPQSGEIFDPRTVLNKVDLTSDTGSVIPMVIDIKNNQVIWTDITLTGSFYRNTTEDQLGSMSFLVKGMVNLNKPNLYDLFSMHAKARGEVIDDITQADTVFALNQGITPYDMDIIASEYMLDVVDEPKPKKTKKS